MRLFTVQHKNILDDINNNGRYIVHEQYIASDMLEHKNIILEVYKWLADNVPIKAERPKDVKYLVWATNDNENSYPITKDFIKLELEVDESNFYGINISKWGTIMNFCYIPKDEEDKKRHNEMMKNYGLSDTKCYMSQFYLDLKKEIRDSWQRLFDKNIILDKNYFEYIVLWEIKKEWIVNVIK